MVLVLVLVLVLVVLLLRLHSPNSLSNALLLGTSARSPEKTSAKQCPCCCSKRRTLMCSSFFGSMLKLVTRTHSAEMFFEVVQKQRDLNMFACLFLASLEPGCNEHQRTLIRTAWCAYTRRSRPAENLRITPKLQVYFTNMFGFLNKAPLVATCCPPCNQTMLLLQHVWLHAKKKRLIFAVVANRRCLQFVAKNA